MVSAFAWGWTGGGGGGGEGEYGNRKKGGNPSASSPSAETHAAEERGSKETSRPLLWHDKGVDIMKSDVEGCVGWRRVEVRVWVCRGVE